MTRPPDPDPTRDDFVSPAERDRILEAAVLRLLLTEHPTQLTATELATELGESGDVPAAVEDAVSRLVSVGLVHRHGQFVVPTRAALYFDQLPID